MEVVPGEVGGRARCRGAEGREEPHVGGSTLPPAPLSLVWDCSVEARQGVPKLRVRSVAGHQEQIAASWGSFSKQPPSGASTERLLFQGSCRKLEPRTLSPTHARNFPRGMGWRGASSCPWGWRDGWRPAARFGAPPQHSVRVPASCPVLDVPLPTSRLAARPTALSIHTGQAWASG